MGHHNVRHYSNNLHRWGWKVAAILEWPIYVVAKARQPKIYGIYENSIPLTTFLLSLNYLRKIFWRNFLLYLIEKYHEVPDQRDVPIIYALIIRFRQESAVTCTQLVSFTTHSERQILFTSELGFLFIGGVICPFLREIEKMIFYKEISVYQESYEHILKNQPQRINIFFCIHLFLRFTILSLIIGLVVRDCPMHSGLHK